MTTNSRDLVDATIRVAGFIEELKNLNLPALQKSFEKNGSTCCCHLVPPWAHPLNTNKDRQTLESFFRKEGLLGEGEPLVSDEWQNASSWPESCFNPLWPLARFVRGKSDPLGYFFFGDGELGPALSVARAAQSAFSKKDGVG